MEKLPPPLSVARLVLISIGLWLGGSAAWAATLSVTPSAISNQYAGMITLAITGLTNGETVTIDKFLDANTNGVIDGGDLLGQRFELTDNQASLIGGATNVNVPGDSNPAVSNVTTLLNFESIDIEHVVGSYLFRLSSPTARFTPVINTFNITNSAYLQSFTGQVRSNGTAVANAIVIVLGTNQNSKNFVGGTVADNSGNYTLKAAPGTYMVFAAKSNFVADLAAPPLTLGAGITVTSNLNLLPTTRTVSGKVADAGDNAGLPGVFILCQSTNNLFAMGFTDTNGNFNVPVTASGWDVGVNDSDAMVHGYIRLQSSPNVITTTGSVAGVNLLLPKGTALFYGSVKDDLGNPLPGFAVSGNDQDTYQYASGGGSDANGSYAVAALAGNWNAQLSSEDPRLSNYVYSGNLGTTLLTNGQAVRQDFVLKLATNHITGYVRDNLSNPIVGVSVFANANLNGTNFNAGDATTDGSGNYTLNVGNGDWQVGVSCGGGNNSLDTFGYQCVNNQQVTISGNNGVANFTAQPCGALQVATGSLLPGGQVGQFYQLPLQANGCNQPFIWDLAPGSQPLPGGLDMNSPNGYITGTPSTAGIFNFTLRVSDSTFAMATQAVSLTIAPAGVPLQVTTASLPNGTNGVFYSQSLNASGGQPPYSWYLPGGTITLPPGTMSLSTNGILSGTPTASGTYNFWVGVQDSTLSVVATQYLSLTINASSSLLQVTTLTLPKGTVTGSYNTQLGASGGQPPYHWTLPLGSAPLPSGLLLATNGLITGTCTTTGSFPFIVYLADAGSASVYQPLQIIVNPRPSLSFPAKPSASQFRFQVNGVAGQNYTIQASTNLINWSSLTVTNSPTDVFTVLLTSGTPAQSFYRVLVGP